MRSTIVQSGPGTIPPFYATGQLQAGQRVVIVSEEGDFYGIQPPPGSFSYVPRSAVRIVPGENGVGVVQEMAATLIGSELGPDATTHGVRLTPGTLLRILGETRIQVGQQWLEVYRIEPVGERRYVARSALSLQQTAIRNHLVSPPATLDGAFSEQAALRQQADRAYQQGCQTGDFTEAKRLYHELGRYPDSQLRWEALNRLEFIRLREREWASRPLTDDSVRPTAFVQAKAQMRPVGQVIHRPDSQTSWKALGSQPPHAATQEAGRIYGVLRQSAFIQRGKPLYFVEDHLGRLRCYVELHDLPQAEPLLNRPVEIAGRSLGYRGELRADLVVAVSIRPLE